MPSYLDNSRGNIHSRIPIGNVSFYIVPTTELYCACCFIIILTTVNQVRFRTRSNFSIHILARNLQTSCCQSGLRPGSNGAPPSPGLLIILRPVKGQSGLRPRQIVSIISHARAVVPRLEDLKLTIP